jgi:hypothetical protein
MHDVSLPSLIRDYRCRFGPRLAEYLAYFHDLRSPDDAMRFVCHGKEGRINAHQRRVGRAILERARKSLARNASKIQLCRTFDDLIGLVENCTKNIPRFGTLAVYDTSLRLGAYLDLWPDVVYLHAGTKKGCRALGIPTNSGTVEMRMLPRPLRVLKPHEAEDFLCIFKDQFAGAERKLRGCLPKGC